MVTVETSLRMTWTDQRLNITIPDDFPTNYIRFGPDVLKYIWIPDVYIDGLKDLRMPAYKVSIIKEILKLNSSDNYLMNIVRD